jgi:hypothetical protein
MQELKLLVPTYNGKAFESQVSAGKLHEFGVPRVPVLIREADGVRIVLGTHDYEENGAPDIQIERRPKGWAFFLHPRGAGDPSGFVYFLDDGRSFVVKEIGAGAIELADDGDQVRAVD